MYHLFRTASLEQILLKEKISKTLKLHFVKYKNLEQKIDVHPILTGEHDSEFELFISYMWSCPLWLTGDAGCHQIVVEVQSLLKYEDS